MQRLRDLYAAARAAGGRRRIPPTPLLRLAFLLLLPLQTGCLRQMVISHLERSAFVTPPAGVLTPDSLGIPSRQLTFPSGDRLLHGSFVQAPGGSAPAVLIFHGDEETVSQWAPVQKRLHDAGISSLVFNYSGYGASTGRPTMKRLREDGLAAYREFSHLVPDGSRRYVLGFSLGSAVMLEVAHQLAPAPHGVIVASGFASTREMAVAQGRVPAWLAWALPNLWNNERRVARLPYPVLIVHSRADRVVPFAHAERLDRAARSPHRLVALDSLDHGAALHRVHAARFWAPIIRHVQAGGLEEAERRTPDEASVGSVVVPAAPYDDSRGGRHLRIRQLRDAAAAAGGQAG